MGRRNEVMVDIEDLGLIPRILFATDGAITHILEVYAGEAVELVTLSLSSLADASTRRELGVAANEKALHRISLLRGRVTGRPFVHGDSVIVLDRLPPQVANELVKKGGGLLKLLSKHRVGTFRETIGEWEGVDAHLAARFGLAPTEMLVGRTYEVVIGGQPAAWITERFPKHGFSTPSDAVPAGRRSSTGVT